MQSKLYIFSLLVVFLSCSDAQECKSPATYSYNQLSDSGADQRVAYNLNISDDEYYGKNNLLLDSFLTEEKHYVWIKGSVSGDMYQIDVLTNQNKFKSFDIAEHWYGASHSSISWINNNYILIRQGCGTMCWMNLVLPLNDERKEFQIMYPVYSDKIGEIIIAPDQHLEELLIHDLGTRDSSRVPLEICSQGVAGIISSPIDFEKVSNEKLIVKFKGHECQDDLKIIGI